MFIKWPDDVYFHPLPAKVSSFYYQPSKLKTGKRFHQNMGIADRIIRILPAAVFAYLYFAGAVTGKKIT
jgi:hypothetical protein